MPAFGTFANTFVIPMHPRGNFIKTRFEISSAFRADEGSSYNQNVRDNENDCYGESNRPPRPFQSASEPIYLTRSKENKKCGEDKYFHNIICFHFTSFAFVFAINFSEKIINLS